MSREEALSLGKGLLIGLVVEQIRGRVRFLYIGFGVVGAAAVVGLVVLDGAWRGVAAAILAIVATIAVVVWLLTRVAVGLLNRFAPARMITGDQEAIDEAVAGLALPSGPISAARFGWRLRRGVDDEVQRIIEVLSGLAQQLGLSSAEPQ